MRSGVSFEGCGAILSPTSLQRSLKYQMVHSSDIRYFLSMCQAADVAFNLVPLVICGLLESKYSSLVGTLGGKAPAQTTAGAWPKMAIVSSLAFSGLSLVWSAPGLTTHLSGFK